MRSVTLTVVSIVLFAFATHTVSASPLGDQSGDGNASASNRRPARGNPRPSNPDHFGGSSPSNPARDRGTRPSNPKHFGGSRPSNPARDGGSRPSNPDHFGGPHP